MDVCLQVDLSLYNCDSSWCDACLPTTRYSTMPSPTLLAAGKEGRCRIFRSVHGQWSHLQHPLRVSAWLSMSPKTSGWSISVVHLFCFEFWAWTTIPYHNAGRAEGWWVVDRSVGGLARLCMAGLFTVLVPKKIRIATGQAQLESLTGMCMKRRNLLLSSRMPTLSASLERNHLTPRRLA